MFRRFIVAFCLALGLACAAPLCAADEAPAAAKRSPLPDELRGKPALVNFWATWCTPCRNEIPALIDAYEDGRDRGLAIVGVALDDDEAAVHEFAARRGISYPIVTGKAQAIALMRELGNDRSAVPFTVALNRNGTVVAKKFGMLRPGDLARLLAAAFGPAKSDTLALHP